MLREILLGTLFIGAAWTQNPTTPQIQTVVVTGTFEPLPLQESDRSVTGIDLDSTKRVLFGSVTDVLRLDPSIDLQARGPAGIQTDLTIRGGSFGQTLVLLNGFRLDDAQSAHHNMDIPVPLEAISRIEVLKGSGSTFYGSDAVDGAIDILAKPPESSELHLRSALGNFGINQESGAWSTVTKRFSEELAFSRDFSTGFIPDRDYRNLQLASVTHLTSRWGASDVLLAGGDKPFGADQFYGNFNSWERTREWFASLHQELGSNTQVDFGYRRHTDLFVLYRDQPQIFTNRHADETYQVAVRRSQRLHLNTSMHYGIEGYRDTIASNNLGYHQRNRGAAYAGIDFRALGRLSLSLAAREELYTIASRPGTHAQLSPTVAGGMWLTHALRLRASASSAFRLPSYTDLYYHDPANLGSPDLRPEHAASYEAGLEWFRGPRFRLWSTFFNRRERDGIDYVRASANDLWRATNIDQLVFTGAEAGIAARLTHSQEIDISYTALHATQDMTQAVLTKYVFNYPSHSATVSWQGTLPKSIVARSRVGAVNRRGRVPYALWDLYGASTRGRVHPFLQLTNLANISYQEILGVAMPGRTIVGGLEWIVFGTH